MSCVATFDPLTNKVTIRGPNNIYYTLDGSDPSDEENADRIFYKKAFAVDRGLIIKYWCEKQRNIGILIVPPLLSELCFAYANLPVTLALAVNELCNAGLKALRLVVSDPALGG